MWTCPECGRRFANRNQTHTCGPLRSVEDHLAGKPAAIVETYRALEAAARAVGPIEVLGEKTRIAFFVRMSFGGARVLKSYVEGAVVLARRIEDPRFTSILSASPRNHVHYWRMRRPEDVDDQVRDWLAEAYDVGEQKRLERRSSSGSNAIVAGQRPVGGADYR